MSKKYYTVFPGEVPSIHDREGKTREEIINSENTLMCLVTLKRMKEKLIEYLEKNSIEYTKLIIAPSFDFFLSEDDVISYPHETSEASYNWGMHLDMINEYVSVDLTCVVYENGEDEEFISPETIKELGIDLTPITVNYNVFVKMISKQNLGNHNLPETFGKYKMRYIEEEVRETLGYNLPTDIVVAEKRKSKGVI